LPDTLTLLSLIHSELGEDDDRDRVSRQPFAHTLRRIPMRDTTHAEAVVANHDATAAGNIGLSTISLLVNEGESFQKPIEFFLTAVERSSIVRRPEFLDGRER
jgi:hypothetical protein